MIRFGIDFGGVIVKARSSQAHRDTVLEGSEGSEIAQPGVFEAIQQLVTICDGQAWIVSKAGPRMQAHTLAWLDAVQFYSRTGFSRDHVRFCMKREEKEPISRELRLTHFIDDRVHVMQVLRATVSKLYLFAEPGTKIQCPSWATLVHDWNELVNTLEV